MKANLIATVITEVYNNGHVKAGGQKLQYEDFLQLVYLARAEALDNRIRQDRAEGVVPNLEDLLQRKVFAVQTDEYGRQYVELPSDPVSLPDNVGIFTVLPLSTRGPQACRPLTRMPAGSEWLFCNDTGISSFVPYGRRLNLLQLPDCTKEVEVAWIGNDEDSDVPDQLGFAIARGVWQQVFRSISLPIDKYADGNPNWEEIFKTKLSTPQTK